MPPPTHLISGHRPVHRQLSPCPRRQRARRNTSAVCARKRSRPVAISLGTLAYIPASAITSALSPAAKLGALARTIYSSSSCMSRHVAALTLTRPRPVSYRIHLSPGSRRTSSNNARSLNQGVMAINGNNGGVRKRSATASAAAKTAPAPDSPPSTPPPLEQAYIAPQLPPPELTTSHAWLTTQNSAFALEQSEPQPIPQTNYARHSQHSSFGDLSFAGTSSLPGFDFGSGQGTSQSLPSLGASLGSLYMEDFSPPPLAYAVRPSMSSQQQMHAAQHSMQIQQQNSQTPSPVPSTLSVTSSHGSGQANSHHYFDTRAAHGMRALDTNSLVFPAEISASDRYMPPPSSTVYMSLSALDAAHQSAAATWHGGGGGRSLHGPNSRLMRA